jgi:hypothetical protein
MEMPVWPGIGWVCGFGLLGGNAHRQDACGTKCGWGKPPIIRAGAGMIHGKIGGAGRNFACGRWPLFRQPAEIRLTTTARPCDIWRGRETTITTHEPT